MGDHRTPYQLIFIMSWEVTGGNDRLRSVTLTAVWRTDCVGGEVEAGGQAGDLRKVMVMVAAKIVENGGIWYGDRICGSI